MALLSVAVDAVVANKNIYIFNALENRARLAMPLRSNHCRLLCFSYANSKIKIKNPFYYANILDDRKICYANNCKLFMCEFNKFVFRLLMSNSKKNQNLELLRQVASDLWSKRRNQINTDPQYLNWHMNTPRIFKPLKNHTKLFFSFRF